MLRVLLYTESDSADVKTIGRYIIDAGGELVATFGGEPPPLGRLFEYNLDVVVTGSVEPVSLVWAFLLRLRRFRLQGMEWPKIILAAFPTGGLYIPEQGCYDEKELDYFYIFPPYRDLYDISLDRLKGGIGPCLAVLEVEHLAHTTGMRKQWLLSDTKKDYGKLTFEHLEYIHLSPPAVVCAFEPYSPFSEISPLFEQGGSLQTLQLRLKPVGETMRVDGFLLDPGEFWFFIEGEEAGFRLRPTIRESPGD